MLKQEIKFEIDGLNDILSNGEIYKGKIGDECLVISFTINPEYPYNYDIFSIGCYNKNNQTIGLSAYEIKSYSLTTTEKKATHIGTTEIIIEGVPDYDILIADITSATLFATLVKK